MDILWPMWPFSGQNPLTQVNGMDIEEADEVKGRLLLLLPCLLGRSHHFEKALHIVHESFGNEIIRTCVSCYYGSEKLSLTKFGVRMCKL